jgi:hypothetical protein
MVAKLDYPGPCPHDSVQVAVHALLLQEQQQQPWRKGLRQVRMSLRTVGIVS